MSVLHLIAQNSFLTVNKHIASEYGLEAAVLLGELASSQVYFEQTGGVDGDGMFYETGEQITKNTTLTAYQQAKACNRLEDAGVLKTKRKGVPARKYYHINSDALMQYFENKFPKNLKTRNQKTKELEPQFFENINNKREINKRETINISAFEHLWSVYPRKQGKKEALEAYKRAIRDGEKPEAIEKGIQAYNSYIQKSGIEPQYIKQGSTFFRQRAWNDDWTPRKPRARNGFNEFEHNQYDFDELEKEIVNNA